jgi:hypothetical protein
MFKLARWAISGFCSLIGLYVFFFVPIGRRTLYDHARRIATTPEAREFGDEMRTAGGRVAARTREEVEGAIRHGVLPVDGGARVHAQTEPPSPPPPHLSPGAGPQGDSGDPVGVELRLEDGGLAVRARPTLRGFVPRPRLR